MIRKQKKKAAQDSEEKLKKQDQMNMANAAAMIRHSVDSVISTGVGLSLIELLKTVQHWPALIDITDTVEFSPNLMQPKFARRK